MARVNAPLPARRRAGPGWPRPPWRKSFRRSASSVWWTVVVPLSLVTVLGVFVAKERSNRFVGPTVFPPEDIEEARRRVMPFRQSGLIYRWETEEPFVVVRRRMWDALSEATKRELGQAIAVAKDLKQIGIRDEVSEADFVVCTATGKCRQGPEGTPTRHESPHSRTPTRTQLRKLLKGSSLCSFSNPGIPTKSPRAIAYK